MSTDTAKPVKHLKTVQDGIDVCAAVGLVFWSRAPGARTFWAVGDGRFHKVRVDRHASRIVATPCTSHGITNGDTFTAVLPAPHT